MLSGGRATRLAALIGGTGGAAGYYLWLRRDPEVTAASLASAPSTPLPPPYAVASWTTNSSPSVRWDFNWDRRDPRSLVKPSDGTPEDDARYGNQLEERRPKFARHIFFIRHGQYNLKGKGDAERSLTKLGRQQAELTGKRLKVLNIPWDTIENSTMLRAKETGDIIVKQLGSDAPRHECPMLEEGAPSVPEPPVNHWKPEPHQFFQEGARIEAAFRKYIYRASHTQEKDSYTLIVCHANVIRYFVCRAMQFPPEAWLRISLGHASITSITIQPSGRVTLNCLGETGHMSPENITKS